MQYVLSEESAQLADAEIVGRKCRGLLSVPRAWRLPLVIVTAEAHRKWKSGRPLDLPGLAEAAIAKAGWTSEMMMLRSSGTNEDMHSRGRHRSVARESNPEDLASGLATIWQTERDRSSSDGTTEADIAILIQPSKRRLLTGHLSNERRLTRQSTIWIYEYSDGYTGTHGRAQVRDAPLSIEERLACSQMARLIPQLMTLANYLATPNHREHLEWVWDGETIWVVQRDIESTPQSQRPCADAPRPSVLANAEPRDPFRTVSQEHSHWPKARALLEMRAAGLPTASILALTGTSIKRLDSTTCELAVGLKMRLQESIAMPAVVRVDVASKDDSADFKVLQPRSMALPTADAVLDFIIARLREAKDQSDQLLFLLHSFIPATASCWTYADSSARFARVDATWGLADALSFAPHDSFSVDLSGDNIGRTIRYKDVFLDCDSEGRFVLKPTGRPMDWNPSIDTNQAATAAQYARSMANQLGHPVNLMCFVGTLAPGHPDVLPWVALDAPNDLRASRIASRPFDLADFVIADENSMKAAIASWARREPSSSPTATAELKLGAPDLARPSSRLISELGREAARCGVTIRSYGSVLSHTYYLLREAGARVELADIEEPVTGHISFDKAVRDGIPHRIAASGDRASIRRADPPIFNQYLRAKVFEEATELVFANGPDVATEMADVLELLAALADAEGIEWADVERVRHERQERRGGFQERLILLGTDLGTEPSDQALDVAPDLPGALPYRSRRLTQRLANGASFELDTGTLLAPGEVQLVVEVAATGATILLRISTALRDGRLRTTLQPLLVDATDQQLTLF